MKTFAYPINKSFPYIIIIIAYVFYVIVFAAYHDHIGVGVTALSIIPVIGASWYFGVAGGVLTAILTILADLAVLSAEGHPYGPFFESPGNLIGTLSLLWIGIVVGKMGTTARERREAITRLTKNEFERQSHTDFLELLNEITGMALEAENLDLTIQTLVERIGKLFKADHCFFSLWDEAKAVPIPVAAYGSMSDVYPFIQFDPGQRTPTTSAIAAGHPLAISDLDHSPYIDAGIAAIFPSHSMLALPLITQSRTLGALLLGYDNPRSFDKNDLTHANVTAEQVTVVLSKALALEEERKQVKRLTALHDIALISIDVDSEDELISRVTDVIGKNLFPDNFGILLLDEQAGVLRAHPSYRFSAAEERHMTGIPVEQGVSGQVARTGQAQRIGNVRRIKEYVNVDDRTVSELCVPIKFKERILGVINAESTKRNAFTEDDERLLITLAGQIATAMEQIRRAQAERKWLNQLAHSKDLIYALAQITTHIEKAFSIDDIIKNLGIELSKIDLTCMMAVYDKERSRFNMNYTSMEAKLRESLETSLGYPLIRYSFSQDQLNTADLSHPTVISRAMEEIQILFAHADEPRVLKTLQEIGLEPNLELLRLPLVFEENLLGVLWIWGKELTSADLPIMSIFAKQIGVSLERARLFQEVQSLALTDSLTGLHNRRSLFELGRVEFSRAHRMNRAFCCMMLDLDYFKHINDAYGHPVGDEVLHEFALRCKNSVREIDLVGRYGGEEIIILLPETDRTTAMKVAERLRSSIAAKPIQVCGTEVPITVSIGVATKDENTTHLDTLIARADQAMYIAKHKGRNQVAMSK